MVRGWWVFLSVICGIAAVDNLLYANRNDKRSDCSPESMAALTKCLSKLFGDGKHFVSDNLWLRMETGNYEFDFNIYARLFKSHNGCARLGGADPVCLNLHFFPRAFIDMHFEIGIAGILARSERCKRPEVAISAFRVAHYSARTFDENGADALATAVVNLFKYLGKLCGEFPRKETCYVFLDYLRSQEMYGPVVHQALQDFCKKSDIPVNSSTAKSAN